MNQPKFLNPVALLKGALVEEDTLTEALSYVDEYSGEKLPKIFSYFIPEGVGFEANKLVIPSLLVRDINAKSSLYYDGIPNAYDVHLTLSLVTESNKQQEEIGQKLMEFMWKNNFHLIQQKTEKLPESNASIILFTFNNSAFTGNFNR